MEIYCLQEFKTQFDKLKKKGSYKGIESEIIDNFFGKNPLDFFKNGAKITGTNDIPFIKKRVTGRGGWRFYYLLMVKKEKLYLMYLHPKRGSEGAENITDEFEKQIYTEVLSSIKSDDLYTVTNVNGKLQFKHHLLEKEDVAKMAELVKPIKEGEPVVIKSEVRKN